MNGLYSQIERQLYTSGEKQISTTKSRRKYFDSVKIP